MEQIIDVYLKLMLAVLFAAGWFLQTSSLLALTYLVATWLAAYLAVPFAAAALVFFANNAQLKEDVDVFPRSKPLPPILHVAILAMSRVCFRRSLPHGLISTFLNAASHRLCRALFEHRCDVPLARAERCVTSQFGEDGVIEALFDQLGHGTRLYVEFGTEDASECNTRYLREAHGWTGLMMDGGESNSRINLKQEFIHPDNVEDLFAKHGIPEDFDFLSIDIDSNDYWVWKAITKFRPRVVCLETNASWGLADAVVAYDRNLVWNHSNYFGASITAYTKLARKKGYSLVHSTLEGVNIFFVRDDLVASLGNLVPEDLINNPRKCFRRCPAPGPHGGHRPDPACRKTVSSSFDPPELKHLAMKAGMKDNVVSSSNRLRVRRFSKE